MSHLKALRSLVLLTLCSGAFVSDAATYWEGVLFGFKFVNEEQYASLQDNPNVFGVTFELAASSAEMTKAGILKITSLAPSSPFLTRGMRVGDIIFAADLQVFTTAEALSKYIRTRPQDRLLSLHYFRPGDDDEPFVADVNRSLLGGL